MATRRLECLLDFLGVPWETLRSDSDAVSRGANGTNPTYQSILAPLTNAAELWQIEASRVARSLFFYATDDTRASSQSLGVLTGRDEDALLALKEKDVDVTVSEEWPALTGPMCGLRSSVSVRSCDYVAAIRPAGSVSTIIGTEKGSLFFRCKNGDALAFVSCSSEIPNLNEPVGRRGYDVRSRFLSAVPLLMYLKWAFRDVCWQANEAGACLMVDDPILRMKYGFCDFRLLDAQMKQHSFTTNIAMIPWNRGRTSTAMASLIKGSTGRFSVSVHGCDHTAGEFGIANTDELGAKVESASRWMEQHRNTTGVAHDAIMVFPQGVFSRESLRILQQHEFVAAVNTEGLPFPREGEVLTTGDVWAVAISRYGSFPVFTRRYPADGLANFAFDALLGKPCLIVEHHHFFKGEHQDVVRFVAALNSLNGILRWRSLGEVIRRSYQWRLGPSGAVQVRMFANELLLKNASSSERQYQIEKADLDSAGVREVTANGHPLAWQTDGPSIVFICPISAGAEVLIQVRYTPLEKKEGRSKDGLNRFVKIATRRYLSEFRDNFLSRHDSLMAIAQKARRIASNSR